MSELKNIPGIPPRTSTAPATPSPDYFESRAAAQNAVRVREVQLGRTFSTPEDARAAWIIESTLMALQACEVVTRLGAPQTQAKAPEVAAFAAVEKALTLSDDSKAA